MENYKIYPKQFKNDKIAIEKKRCFFIMPFWEEFDITYGELKTALSKDGFTCIRADEITGSVPIMNTILKEMLKAQFIIADLTNNNPNVFYELGIAHTFKDAENIILIKREGSKIPFDITHLTYIEYNPDNFKFLTARLKQCINQNAGLTNFYDTLNIHGIIKYTHNNQDEFVEIIKETLGMDLDNVTNLLNKACKLQPEDVEKIIYRFYYHLKNLIFQYDSTILTSIFDFYSELLLACNEFYFVADYIQIFITDFFSTTNLPEADSISYITDLTLKFAKERKQLNIVMPWIIGYFRRSKNGKIDLNRYKLESFLLTTQIDEINDIICTAITDNNFYIREHLADIIGEKRLMQASTILANQLVSEKNYYTASSFITALGKLGDKYSLPIIYTWLEENAEDLIKKEQWWFFNHVRISISKIDITELADFENKYAKFFKENYI